jgi:hypothetical protein
VIPRWRPWDPGRPDTRCRSRRVRGLTGLRAAILPAPAPEVEHGRFAPFAVDQAGSLTCALVAALGPGFGQREEQRRVYVAVADASGRPIADRPADAFRIWENETARPIVSATPADNAPSVVVIVHGAGRDDTLSVRKALAAVVDAFRHEPPRRCWRS